MFENTKEKLKINQTRNRRRSPCQNSTPRRLSRCTGNIAWT